MHFHTTISNFLLLKSKFWLAWLHIWHRRPYKGKCLKWVQHQCFAVVLWFRKLVAGFSTWRSELKSKPIYA